jgi:hypothetical protein
MENNVIFNEEKFQADLTKRFLEDVFSGDMTPTGFSMECAKACADISISFYHEQSRKIASDAWDAALTWNEYSGSPVHDLIPDKEGYLK